MIAKDNILTHEADLKNSECVIYMRDVCKSFGDHHVLTNFNLDLHRGENIVVLGKSGSGKSVLIKCIIGLMKQNSGVIKLFGQDILTMTQGQLDKIRMKIGFLFQSNALYDSMTIRENLEFPLRRHGIELTKTEINDRVMEALNNVGLAHTVNMQPSELSGGMKKRIALARTLILKPEVILYDEPTTGLDPITGKEISNLMRDLGKKYNTSSIVISHDLNCVKVVADSVVMLIDGKCYAQGTFAELQTSSDEKIKQFFD